MVVKNRLHRSELAIPVVGFFAGVSAPPGRRMGHAGAIISTESDTAGVKMDAMEELGLYVTRNPAHIGQTVLRAMQEHDIKF